MVCVVNGYAKANTKQTAMCNTIFVRKIVEEAFVRQI